MTATSILEEVEMKTECSTLSLCVKINYVRNCRTQCKICVLAKFTHVFVFFVFMELCLRPALEGPPRASGNDRYDESIEGPTLRSTRNDTDDDAFPSCEALANLVLLVMTLTPRPSWNDRTASLAATVP